MEEPVAVITEVTTAPQPPGAPPPPPFWTEIIKLLPTLLWFGLVLGIVLASYRPVMEQIKKGGLRRIGVGNVQLEFAEIHLRHVRGLQDQGISESDQKVLLGRFDTLADQLGAASILWVDGKHPQQNASLRPLLNSLGVNIDLANSTDDAMKWLGQARYDVVITNLDRPNDATNDEPCYQTPKPANAGCALLKKIGGSRKGEWPWLVVYTLDFNPDWENHLTPTGLPLSQVPSCTSYLMRWRGRRKIHERGSYYCFCPALACHFRGSQRLKAFYRVFHCNHPQCAHSTRLCSGCERVL